MKIKRNKIRLDNYLVQKEFAESREAAKRLILAGRVKVSGTIHDKAGEMIYDDEIVEVDIPLKQFVGRGGLKLDGVLDEFKIDVTGFIAADIGASTGGFTDCLLQRGAAKVYAVDVGYGQLHWKLRNDPRIIVMEQFNARYLRETDLPEKVDIIVMDVSFISVTKIWNNLKNILKPGGILLVLVKPQFEAGRENIPKGGVIKDPKIHLEVLNNTVSQAKTDGWQIQKLIPSPIKGSDGNREYWLYLTLPEYISSQINKNAIELNLDEIIARAFKI